MNTLIGILVGATLTLICTLIANRISYRNEFYKMVIEKRIHAYNNIEHLAIAIKSNSFKHIMDSIDNNKIALLQPLVEDIKLAKSETMWLSKEMKSALDELDESVLSFEMENYDNVDFKKGSQFHININEKIKIIEQILKKDMISMHRVRRFLNNNRG